MDVFKLPGDRLTSTSAIQHIPTRSFQTIDQLHYEISGYQNTKK